jgi:predicted dehydrogenase
MLNVRINAGYLPPDHWTQHKNAGGRILGELCHFVDFARAVVSGPIETVSARALPDKGRYNRDNVAATLTFRDGSIASILYLANGDKSVPKEYFEVFCEGRVARLDDFTALELTCNGKSQRTKSARDKGHNREIAMTIEAIRRGEPAPIPFAELVEVSDASFAIEESIVTGETIRLQNLKFRASA